MIIIDINLDKLDKARFKEFKRRDNSTGKSMKLVLIESPNSEFGDYIIKQDSTKEERDKGVQMPIVGNGKIVSRRGGPPVKQPEAPDDDAPPF